MQALRRSEPLIGTLTRAQAVQAIQTQTVPTGDNQQEECMLAQGPNVAAPGADGGTLNQLIWGFTRSQAVYVTAKLGIVDVLSDGAQTPRAIAERVGADERALRRLLRALTTIDILVEDRHERFPATPTGELLRSNHPQSVRAFAICMGAPLVWRPWGELCGGIQTGTPAFDDVYGESFFAYLGRRPEQAALFDAAMTSISSGNLPAILAAYDFSGLTKIIDIGGGRGTLLQGILEQYPQASGVLFDLLPVVTEAHPIKASSVAARCSFVGGDMFRAVPPDGDAYILKSILHDWSDAEALQILRNCRQVIAEQGKLLVVELLLAPSNQPDFTKWLDLNMLVLLSGRERSEAEFCELYAIAGFRLTRIIPLGARAIIEGVPI